MVTLTDLQENAHLVESHAVRFAVRPGTSGLLLQIPGFVGQWLASEDTRGGDSKILGRMHAGFGGNTRKVETMKYGKISDESLRDAVAYSSANDIDIRRMADEITLTRERVGELRAWAGNRLRCCETALTGRNGNLTGDQVNAYEQERMTLDVVMRLLDGEQ